MVDVNTQNKTISVNVSSSGVSSNVNASGDYSYYYSEKAREWAISNRIVDGVDYSSKYYAGKANESASNAQSFAQSAQDSYNNFQDSVDGALSNIESAVQDAVDDINNTKTDIITDIELVADGAKEEIEDLVDTGKDELKEVIGDVKVLTTLEIGDIGIAPLGIDETKGKRRYLNGQIVIQDQYVQFTNKLKSAISLYPSLACTEEEWQTTALLTVGGQVGKFVVDDEAGTIRLPKIIMPIQGLTDLSKLAEIVEAGLPNITGKVTASVGATSFTSTGALTATEEKQIKNIFAAGTGLSVTSYNINASKSNPIYSNSDTVQQEQIQYPYFIQVATGAETEDNIINEIELNNPYSLFDSKYVEAPLYNVSWLLSNGSYNGSNAVHPSAYQALLVENNTEVEVGSSVTLPIGTEYTKRGLSVKLSTDNDITDYDFVLNTAEETFRLPIKVKLASGKAVVGNGMTLGLTNGINNFGLQTTGSTSNLMGDAGSYGVDLPSQTDGGGSDIPPVNKVGITTDATKSGIETSDSDLYLYFYVGETIQNASLINAGRIEEKVASLISDNSSLISGYAMPSNRYVDLTLGASNTTYVAPANGWVSVYKTSGGTQQYLHINASYCDIISHANSGAAMALTLPVLKGQQFRIGYSASGALNYCRFVYAEGDE